MKPTLRPVTDSLADDPRDSLLDSAARLGFVLVSFPTSTGQMVWEWRQGDGPRPQFVTERVAREWMSDWIERSMDSRPDALAAVRRTRETPHSVSREAESA